MSQSPATHCRDCNTELNSVNSVYLGGRLKNRCRDCYNIRQKEWRINNPESRSRTVRQNKIVSKYGMTLQKFDEMARNQGGVCAVCHNPNNIEGRELTVDHDHKTGEIRGLLCHSCNLVLGLVGDSLDRLLDLHEYLRNHQEKYNAS